MTVNNWHFTIDSIVDNPDGTATINFDVGDEFKEWFKKQQGLKRWSQKRFESVMIKALMAAVKEDE
jgi:hypothetical protein